MSALEESNPNRKRERDGKRLLTGRTRWKTVSEQQIYSMKLIKALSRTRTDPNFTVRETADRILASAAGGRSRWSRAILANRINRRHKKVKLSGEIRLKKKKLKMMMMRDPFQRKTRVLGELVPGCRKISFSRLIEEVTDYIPALEMQVRAMTAILAGRPAGSNDQP